MIRRTLRTQQKVVIEAENGFLTINTVRIPMSEVNALLSKINTVAAIYRDLNPEELL